MVGRICLPQLKSSLDDKFQLLLSRCHLQWWAAFQTSNQLKSRTIKLYMEDKITLYFWCMCSKYFLLFCILGISCRKLDIPCLQFSSNIVKTGARTFNGSKNRPYVLITIWEDIQHHTNTGQENRQVPSKDFNPSVYKYWYFF